MASRNAADDAAAAKQSSTLSRNALYAPLVAYEQQNVDPSTYMTTRKSIPASLRESSLVDFMQTVSAEKCGDKPLSSQAIEERIRQRALTLVGGGVTSSMTGKQTAAPTKRRARRHKHQLSNRQRKQIMARARQKHPQEESSTMNEKERNKQTFNLLVELNQKWNVYVRKVAGVDESDSSFVLSESAQKTISKRLLQVELVGALVKLIVCRAHKEWVGKEGLIVGTTANTWRLAVGKFSPETKQRQQPKVLVVPKQGSQLMFRIPIKERSPPLCVVVRGDFDSASVSASRKC